MMRRQIIKNPTQGDAAVLDQERPVMELSKSQLRRILVAVDFSEGSRRALDVAAVLAKPARAEIVLLHVFEGVPGELKVLEASFVDTGFRNQAEEDLTRWGNNLGSAGLSAKSLFRKGSSVGREIVEAAGECKADLIVLGKAGAGGLAELLLPNTVKQVLAEAPCPVLVAD